MKQKTMMLMSKKKSGIFTRVEESNFIDICKYKTFLSSLKDEAKSLERVPVKLKFP